MARSTFFAILPRISTVLVEPDEEEDVAEQMHAQPPRPGAPLVLIEELIDSQISEDPREP